MLTIRAGELHGCVLSPLHYSRYTDDSTARHRTNTIFKLADDATVVGLITDDNESEERMEIVNLIQCCQNNNLALNVSKSRLLISKWESRGSMNLFSSTGQQWRESTPSSSWACMSLKICRGHNILMQSVRSHIIERLGAVLYVTNVLLNV